MEAIYFEDVSLSKMREFKQLLDCFKDMGKTLEDLTKVKDQLKSNRLRLLLEFEEEGGLMPSTIKESLKEFEQQIIWKSI